MSWDESSNGLNRLAPWMVMPPQMHRVVGRHRASANPARPRTAQLVISSLLILALTQYGCSSFRVRAPSPDATAPAQNVIAISPNRPAVRVNGAAQLTLRKADGGVRLEQPIIWTSSDPEVLAVVSMGEQARIAGISPGMARVSVNTANGYSAWATVRVLVNLARRAPAGIGCRPTAHAADGAARLQEEGHCSHEVGKVRQTVGIQELER